MEVKLPSGLQVELRKMKVREQDIMADRKKMKSGQGLFDVLDRLCTGVLDAGPYPWLHGQQKVDWTRVLAGDHFHALMQTVCLTHPGLYEFDVNCDHCSEKIQWEIDPLKELKVRSLPEESASRLMLGENKHPATVKSTGQQIYFKLLLAGDGRKVDKVLAQNPERLISCSLQLQIVEVPEVKSGDLGDWVLDLDGDDSLDLKRQFDAASCGVDTEVEVECQSCFKKSRVDVPFDQDFFSGRRRKEPSQPEMAASV